MMKARKRRRTLSREETPPDTSEAEKTVGRRFNWETIFILAIVLVFALALLQTKDFDFRTGLFPWVIGIPVLALAMVQLVSDLTRRGTRRKGLRSAGTGPELPADVVRRRMANIFGWIFGYFVAIWLLGFYIAGPLCTFIQLKIDSRERWLISIVMTVLVGLFVCCFFGSILHVPFPPGQLFVWLKWEF